MLLLKLENEINFDTVDVSNISVTNEDGNEIFKIPCHQPYEKNSSELEALLHTLHGLPSE